jgi:SAM-dependent methyltransferase
MKKDIGEQTLDVMQNASRYNTWVFNKFLKNNLKGDILEIGAGMGTFIFYTKDVGNVTASDINKKYLEKIKNQFDVRVERLDIEKQSLNKKFDGIYSLNVFEHIKDDEEALKNTYKMLKKHGKFVILVPAHQWNFSQMDKGLGHYRRYNKKLLIDKLKEAGFKVKRVEYINMIGALGWFINGKLLSKKKVDVTSVSVFDKYIAPVSLKIENFINPLFGLSVVAIATK